MHLLVLGDLVRQDIVDVWLDLHVLVGQLLGGNPLSAGPLGVQSVFLEGVSVVVSFRSVILVTLEPLLGGVGVFALEIRDINVAGLDPLLVLPLVASEGLFH